MTIFPVMSPDELAQITVQLGDCAQQLAGTLAEFGVALIPNVLSPAECDQLEGLFGQDLADVVDFETLRREPSLEDALRRVQTDVPNRLPHVWPAGTCLGSGGFAIDHGLPQGRLAWGARLNPRLRTIYGILHGCAEEDLVASCDVVFFTPPTVPHVSAEKRLWPHVDQNSHVQESGAVPIFQGALYIWSAETDGASTTVVWPRSHLKPFATLMADPDFEIKGRFNEHYSPISAMSNRVAAAELLDQFKAGARRVPVPAGGLLLWSSRTMHQGHSGGARLAVPVCFEPVERRSLQTRHRKARLVISGMPSTHWAALGYQHGLADTHPAAKPANAACAWPDLQLPLRALISWIPVQDKGVHCRARDKILADADNMFDEVDADNMFCDSLLTLLTPEVAAVL